MATGTGNLPNPGMSFSPFEILTAEEQNNLVENIESLATGTGVGDGAIDTTQLADASVTSDKLDFMTLTLSSKSITSNATGTGVNGIVIPGLASSITIPNGVNRVKLTLSGDAMYNTAANGYVQVIVWDGAVGTSQVMATSFQSAVAAQNTSLSRTTIVSVSSGASKTYNVSIGNAGASGTGTLVASATSPTFFIIESA